jgi:hypothetical protein
MTGAGASAVNSHRQPKEVAMIERKQLLKEDVAHRAYELYTKRGWEPGKDVEDWVRAEKELDEEAIATPAKTRTVGQN